MHNAGQGIVSLNPKSGSSVHCDKLCNGLLNAVHIRPALFTPVEKQTNKTTQKITGQYIVSFECYSDDIMI